jgi:hypothetical protein
VLCKAPKSREVQARVPPAFPVPEPNCHTKYLAFPRSSPPFFLPRAPRLQAASSREIVHMQAGQ